MESRPPKKNSPGRRAIPEDQWTHSNWLNHLADRYASGPGATAGLAKRNLKPIKVFTFQVEDILNNVVPPDSLYWRYNISMPLVNGVGSPHSLRKEADAYLAQLNSKALSRAAATQHFPQTIKRVANSVSWRRSLTGWAPRASLTCAWPSLTSSGRRPRTAGKRAYIRLGVRTRVLSVDRMTLWSTSSSVAWDLPSDVGKFGRRRHAPTPTAWLPPSPPPRVVRNGSGSTSGTI
jgi:hypothetical protein